MEQEDRIRAMVEEAEKAFQLCQAADNTDVSDMDELEGKSICALSSISFLTEYFFA